ncbi:hypothetical protein [Streptomyces sp. MNU89]|uniref:hypothetical protein n=1 Tax=Streptomyces sp. MNU89 TaxID=2560025 RepID=UPI001E417F24|nr:hypothetical protein [Streptomyces sp. MNU89]MCC9741313.1 hypothetical protein [Streptomyces sp. MNU89]
MFQRPAGGDLRDHEPLGNLREGEFTAAASAVVDGLLTEWNPAPVEEPAERMDASDFLREELEDAEDDELHHWGRHLGLLDSTSPWFVFGGELLPNPYLAVAGKHPRFRDLTISVLCGLVHSDAHLDNILVARHRGKSVPSSYRLIDLATFRSNKALSRDVATLLLSALVAHVREPMPQEQRHALLCFVVDPKHGHLSHIPPQVVERVDAIRGRADEIMRQREWLPWKQQFLLSLQAGALAFTTYTNIGEHGRAWFALLAAHAGAQVLRGHGRALPAATDGMPGSQWAWRTPFERITPFPLPGGTSAPRSRASTDQVGTAPSQHRWSVRTTTVGDKTATVGFGPDNTVVVVDGHGGVHTAGPMTAPPSRLAWSISAPPSRPPGARVVANAQRRGGRTTEAAPGALR